MLLKNLGHSYYMHSGNECTVLIVRVAIPVSRLPGYRYTGQFFNTEIPVLAMPGTGDKRYCRPKAYIL